MNNFPTRENPKYIVVRSYDGTVYWIYGIYSGSSGFYPIEKWIEGGTRCLDIMKGLVGEIDAHSYIENAVVIPEGGGNIGWWMSVVERYKGHDDHLYRHIIRTLLDQMGINVKSSWTEPPVTRLDRSSNPRPIKIDSLASTLKELLENV